MIANKFENGNADKPSSIDWGYYKNNLKNTLQSWWTKIKTKFFEIKVKVITFKDKIFKKTNDNSKYKK